MNYLIDFRDKELVFRSDVLIRCIFVPVMEICLKDDYLSISSLLDDDAVERILSFSRIHRECRKVATVNFRTSIHNTMDRLTPFLKHNLLTVLESLDSRIKILFREVAFHELVKPTFSTFDLSGKRIDDPRLAIVRGRFADIVRQISMSSDLSLLTDGRQPNHYLFCAFENTRLFFKNVVLMNPDSKPTSFRERWSLKACQMLEVSSISEILNDIFEPKVPSCLSTPETSPKMIRPHRGRKCDYRMPTTIRELTPAPLEWRRGAMGLQVHTNVEVK